MPYVKIQGQVICSFYHSGDMPAYNFANYAPGNVVVDGVNYPTREHAFQAHKLPIGERASLTSKCGFRANDARKYFLGKKVPDGWHDGGSRDAMYKVIKAFAAQNPTFNAQLLSTAKTPIVEDTGGAKYKDNSWGCGYDGTGENRLGEILMQVRAELQGLDYASALREAQILNDHTKPLVQSLGNRYLGKDIPGTLIQNAYGVEVLPVNYNPYVLPEDPQDMPEDDGPSEATDMVPDIYQDLQSAIGYTVVSDVLGLKATDMPRILDNGENIRFIFNEELVALAFIKKIGKPELADGEHDFILKPGVYFVDITRDKYESLKTEYAHIISSDGGDEACSPETSYTDQHYESIEAAIGNIIAKKELDSIAKDLPVITHTDSGIRFDFTQERVAEALAKKYQVPFAFDPDKACLYVVLSSEQYSSLLTEYMPMVSGDISTSSDTESIPPLVSDDEMAILGSDGAEHSE